MTSRQRVTVLVGVVVAIVGVIVAIVLWRNGIETSTYPPVELDGKTVSGPYQLTRYSGPMMGGATLAAIVAVAASAWAVRAATRQSGS